MSLGRGVDAYSLDIRRIEECRPELLHCVGLTRDVIGSIYRNDAQIHTREVRWAARRMRAPISAVSTSSTALGSVFVFFAAALLHVK